MTSEVIIKPRKPIGLEGWRPQYTFISRLFQQSRISPPAQYAIVRKADGSVDRIEYRDRAEYDNHLSRILGEISVRHERIGKQAGCMCFHCR